MAVEECDATGDAICTTAGFKNFFQNKTEKPAVLNSPALRSINII
jgi:hypothetical protein